MGVLGENTQMCQTGNGGFVPKTQINQFIIVILADVYHEAGMCTHTVAIKL